MQIFVKINDKTNVINIDDNTENQYQQLITKLEEKTGFNKNFFKLRTLSKSNIKKEDLYNEISLQLEWTYLLYRNLYINDTEFFKIPLIILKESNVLLNIFETLSDDGSNQGDDENKIVFNSNNLISKELVNDWINLSFLMKSYLALLGKNLEDLNIPKPLTHKSLKNYIGDEAFDYFDKKELDDLKKLATFTDYLDISYLLETVCAFIAEKYLKNNNLEDISKLNII